MASACASAHKTQAFRWRKLQNGGRSRLVLNTHIFTICARAPKHLRHWRIFRHLESALQSTQNTLWHGTYLAPRARTSSEADRRSTSWRWRRRRHDVDTRRRPATWPLQHQRQQQQRQRQRLVAASDWLSTTIERTSQWPMHSAAVRPAAVATGTRTGLLPRLASPHRGDGRTSVRPSASAAGLCNLFARTNVNWKRLKLYFLAQLFDSFTKTK